MTNEEISTARPTRARFAVSVLFFVNGALISNVLPRLPAIKADLGLSNAQLGVAVGAASLGALLAGPLASVATARFRSGRVGVATAVVYGSGLALVGLAGSWAALAASFVALGVLDVLMDVAMNAHGLHVQDRYGRSIFNSFHAWWSIGATAGGALGAAAAGLGVPVPVHLLTVGVVLAAAALVAGRSLLPGPEATLAAADEPGTGARLRSRPLRLLRTLAPFAALSVAAAFVEDVPGSFGAVYLRDWLGAAPGVAGLAWVGFVGGMTVGRLLADRLVDRYGAGAVMRAGNALAAACLGIALVAGRPAAAIAGFTAVGLGACSTIPSLFVLAGGRARRPADGIALVSWSARIGFFASPALVGVVADAAGLPFGVAICAVAAALIALATIGSSAIPRGSRAH